jgi:hypothetical protein
VGHSHKILCVMINIEMNQIADGNRDDNRSNDGVSLHRKKKDIEIKKDIFYVDIENKSHRIN